MSNSVTKVSTGNDHGGQNVNQNKSNNTAPAASVRISVDQGREIFGKVNVSLKVNSRRSGLERHKQNSVSNEESEAKHSQKSNIGEGARKSERGGNNHGAKNSTQTTVLNNENSQPINSAPGRHLLNKTAPAMRQLNLTNKVFAANNPENNSHSSRGIQQNGFLGEAISQVARQNDIYLSRNAVSNLVNHYEANHLSNRSTDLASKLLPKEIFQIVQTIENQILRAADPTRAFNQHISDQKTIEIPQSLDFQFREAKNLLTKIFGTDEVKSFSHLDIQQRMIEMIKIFLKDLPDGTAERLRDYSAREILSGFQLARGLLSAGSQHSTVSLLEMMQTATGKISLTTMRDLGGLVKVLISEAAAAKSTAHLENAVQKFARILVAINSLETVLAAVKLASQSQFAGGGTSRTSAIVQIYKLINSLILAGEQAMTAVVEEGAEGAQKNVAKGVADKNILSVFPAGTMTDLAEINAADKQTAEPLPVEAESALRQFLEFNPMFVHDKSLSAFKNFDDARQAQNDFVNHHQIEIEEWLRSGNHRLVKDIDFEKPVGIVVERNTNDFFSATTARIVLVRDGSVQGWHFLKSFLVA